MAGSASDISVFKLSIPEVFFHFQALIAVIVSVNVLSQFCICIYSLHFLNEFSSLSLMLQACQTKIRVDKVNDILEWMMLDIMSQLVKKY